MDNKKSAKPRKQRKKLYTLKPHQKGLVFSSHLSKELRKSTGKRAVTLRKGDKVKVMRGGNKGKQGKISRVNRDKRFVFIENIKRKKADGTEILVPFRASNLLVIELESSDAKRIKKAGKEVMKKEVKKELKKEAKEAKEAKPAKDKEGK